MTKIKVKYPSEFKEEVVRPALPSKEPKSILAEDLGIKRSTLHNWISKAIQEKVSLLKTSKTNSTKYQVLAQENRSL